MDKVYSTHIHCSRCVTQFIITHKKCRWCSNTTDIHCIRGFWCINLKMSHSQQIQSLQKKTATTTVTVLNGLSKSISRHGHNQMECNKPWLGFIKDCAIKFLVAGRLFICATALTQTVCVRENDGRFCCSFVFRRWVVFVMYNNCMCTKLSRFHRGCN